MSKKNYKRVKTNSASQLLIDLKPKRNEADVFLNTSVDVTNLVNFINKKKKEGKELTYFHAFLFAIAKTIYNRPKLNRFVANRHTYEHNDVVISFVAKVSFEDNSEEIMIQIPVNKNDTIYDIRDKIKTKIKKIREEKVTKKGANSIIDTLAKLPNIIRIPIVGLLKWMDDKMLLPESIQKDNIYYASAIVTDIGSLKSDSIYHNNTNFGNASSITAIGEIRDTVKVINGKETIIKAANFGINFDERIADGFYLIKSFKLLEHIINNPSLLENKASEIVEQNDK